MQFDLSLSETFIIFAKHIVFVLTYDWYLLWYTKILTKNGQKRAKPFSLT